MLELKSKIRDWWAAAPMTYGEQHGTTTYLRADGTAEAVEIGSKRFFELADERFYSWNKPLHTDGGRFAAIFPYEQLRGRRVLEVGCGMGCMAMNWVQHGAQITAVDLNATSIAQTKRRFELFGLAGDIREADAEFLPFKDCSFDYVYSWGVLHHTPGTEKAISEVRRVLKPQGRTGVMLYHRHSILYLITIAYQEGWINLERSFLDRLALASRYSDGGREEGNPQTWPVTKREVRKRLFKTFRDVEITVLGTDVPHILDAWKPKLAQLMSTDALEALARRFGWSLWINARK